MCYLSFKYLRYSSSPDYYLLGEFWSLKGLAAEQSIN